MSRRRRRRRTAASSSVSLCNIPKFQFEKSAKASSPVAQLSSILYTYIIEWKLSLRRRSEALHS
jgi:hypothetical protein